MARGVLNLSAAPYLLINADGGKTLNQRWVIEGGLTPTQVKAQIIPSFSARLTALGYTDNEIMGLNVLPAYWNDWVCSGRSSNPIDERLTSNNGVIVPMGVYSVNYPCMTDGGEFVGQGTGFAGALAGTASNNTTLLLNRPGWMGGLHPDVHYTQNSVPLTVSYTEMNLIQTVNYGMLGGSNSYTESGRIRQFRCIGDNGSWYDPTYTSNGVYLYDPGENYQLDGVYCEQFNGYGVAIARGTPAFVNYASVFQNALGGIGLIGTSLATINLNMISGDDNPALVVQIDGWGRTSGGWLNVTMGKSESGKRTPNKGQILLWQRSDCYGMTRWMGPADMNLAMTDALFVMKTIPTSLGQVLDAEITGWNCRTLVHDVSAQKRWAYAQYTPSRFVWKSVGGTPVTSTMFDLTTGQMLTSTSVNATDRLGMVPINGVFDYTAGTPTYSLTGGATPPPPPPSCTWVTGPWSAFGPCVGGIETQTRIVTSSVPGCTPSTPMPPATNSQTCGVPPPLVPPLYTLSPFNNTNPSATINITDVPNVKRIVMTNVQFTVPTFSYQKLLVEAGGTTGLRAVPSNPAATQCRFRLPNGNYASSNVLTIQTGVLYPTLELTLPQTMTVASLLAAPGTGSAILLQCQTLQFYDY